VPQRRKSSLSPLYRLSFPQLKAAFGEPEVHSRNIGSGGQFAIYVMLAATVFGYFMRAFGFSIVAFVVAFILTP
jgi:hypothetical protein